MLSYRLSTVNDFHWEFKPVFSYSKPHTFSTFLEKKKKEKMHLISPTIEVCALNRHGLFNQPHKKCYHKNNNNVDIQIATWLP